MLIRIAHRRRTLPELTAIAEYDVVLAGFSDATVLAETEVKDLARAQTKMDGDVEQVRSRKARDQARLDGGTVTSSKELVDLQTEIASLERRQGVLEDEELEIMQNREDAEARLAAVLDQVAETASARDAAVASMAVAEAALDAEAAAASAARALLEPSLPVDLVKLYDTVRAQQGGVGAAALYRGRCEGCHLELGAAEIREVRAAAPDLVLRHDDCRRILIRTSESGLGTAAAPASPASPAAPARPPAPPSLFSS